MQTGKTQKKKYRRKEKPNASKTSNSKASNSKASMKFNNEIVGILLLASGILIALSLYFEKSVGIFGEFIKKFFLGMMGLPAYIIPVMLILYAFLVIFNKNVSNTVHLRGIYTIILLILFSAFLQTGRYGMNPEDFENLKFVNSIALFFRDAQSSSLDGGGGVLGGLITIPFLQVFQVVGTIVILLTLSIIDIVLLTNISVANFLRNIKQLFVKFCRKSVDVFKAERESDGRDEKADDGVVGEGENISIQFKPESRVIDLNIEKTARELKVKTSENGKKTGTISGAVPGTIPDEKPAETREQLQEDSIRLIMKDVRPAAEKNAGDHSEMNEHITIDTHSNPHYTYPSPSLLDEANGSKINLKTARSAAFDGAKKLEDTLKSFGVDAKVVNISRGPAVTRYELQPGSGVKVNSIVKLADDIALNLAAAGVRIEAPIPGKAAVGIEVPNKEVTPVLLREVIESPEFAKHPSKLAFCVGKDVSGESIIADIAKMPHMLIAGATGSGKSVCINSIITSLLYKASPNEVKLLMIDPKVVELGIYNGIPHLLIPVVTDPKKAAGALNWAVQEMVNRYKLFAEKNVRDIKGYNEALKEAGSEEMMTQVVIIIDELADLMMVAPGDVEDAICRLAQMARAAGMHLVVATQRPSVDVITGIIKANIPSRISFMVSSQVDSRTILDMAGAEKLLGKGDMLFYPVGEQKPVRVKGAFISDKEIERVVEFIKSQGNVEYDDGIIEEINSEGNPEEEAPGDNDELLPQAIEMVVDAGQASVSYIQRKFKVGYARAARIVDQMEARGIVGRFEGSKPRQVLISKQQWMEMEMAGGQAEDARHNNTGD